MMEHKILLVDDDRDLLEMLCSIFRRAGYTDLVTAASGQEALQVWQEQQPAADRAGCDDAGHGWL